MSYNVEQTFMFYKLNPVTKLIFFLFFILIEVFIFSHSLPLLTLVLLFELLCLYDLSGEPFKILKNTIRFYPMIIALTIFLPLSGDGEVIWRLYGVSIYQIGIERFVTYNLIMMSLLIYSNLFIITTPVLDVVRWLQKLRFPEKVITILYLVNRFVVIMGEDVRKKITAFKARYNKLSIGFYMYFLSKLVSSVFMNIFLRNEKIYMTLSARNFKGKITTEESVSWKRIDIVASIISLLVFVTLIWMV